MHAWMCGCMDAWVNFALLKKMNYSCMHDLVWCLNFSFLHFFENNIRIDSHFIVISNSWSHSTLIFFYFSKSFPWSNQFTNKHFFNHFFETLFEWHAWFAKGLKKVWMRWWRLTRELPQFELVLGHKMCLGFPQLLMVWRKWWGLQKFAPSVITVFNVNKCPSSEWIIMGIYELQTKWLPQFGFGIDKNGLC